MMLNPSVGRSAIARGAARRALKPWARRPGAGGRGVRVLSLPAQRAEVLPAKTDGPSTDLRVIAERLGKLAMPYWQEEPSARWKLAGVVGLTLATTGVSVMFNFLGRDFFTALSEKDEAAFQFQLLKYLGGFVLGIPVFVFKSYFQSKLALEWRQWMTERLLSSYLSDRTFYGLQQSGEVDNPDQRISSDVATFTDTALGLALTLLNAGIDLVSFSGILYTIYPPLFAALLAYSLGGTAVSVALGKNLVGLNFNQEAREADFRYGLVRVRENAESIAFYGGDQDERQLLKIRLQAAVENYLGLLTASRNLDFFTSFYRYLIQLLPAAVVAPLFFQGKIDFGVINQSQSAFNHILNDASLVIYQFEALAGFSAVVDRLGEFTEAMDGRRAETARLTTSTTASIATLDEPAVTIAALPAASSSAAASPAAAEAATAEAGAAPSPLTAEAAEPAAAPPLIIIGGDDETLGMPGIQLRFLPDAAAAPAVASAVALKLGGVAATVSGAAAAAAAAAAAESAAGPSGRRPLLRVRDLSVMTPRGGNVLLRGLDLELAAGGSLLVMGPSGAGKTSLLRAVAGLWGSGCGRVEVGVPRRDVLFLPQRPYMVLGSLRDQALYPRRRGGSADAPGDGAPSADEASVADGAAGAGPLPSDEEVVAVLQTVQLGHLLTRYGPRAPRASSSSSSSPSSSPSSPNGSSPSAASASSSASTTAAAALDAVADWSSSLSLGEQQRLGWARLLLARPALALLDEATSALDQETEARLYGVLQRSGIAYVSVGHRSTLREFHRSLLQLRPDGRGGVSWEVRPLADAAAVGVAAVAM